MQTATIIQDYIPAYRQKFFIELYKRLDGSGVRLRVFVASQLSRDQEQRGDRAELPFLEFLPGRQFTIFGKRVALRDSRRALDTDLLVIEQARRNLDIYPILLSKRRPVPVALWGHGSDHSKIPSSFEVALLKSLTRRADWFFAYTDESAGDVAKIGFPRHRITVVENSTDTESLTHVSLKDRQAITAKFLESQELSAHVPTISYMGALTRAKRIDVVLEALEIASSRHPGLRLIVAGNGPEERQLHAARERGLNVHHVGYAGTNEKIAIGNISCCLVQPDQVGLIAVDSMAMGTPIITTRVGNHGPEHSYLADQRNALLTDDLEPKTMAEAIERLLSDPRLQRRLQDGCRTDAAHYTTSNMVSRFHDGVLSALHAGRGSLNSSRQR